MPATTKPVAIIGGGLAGLTAADFLRRHGVPVVLFEAGRALAGMAASHRDEHGFTYDFGAHFVTNRLAAAIGVGSRCRDVAYYGESFLVGDRVYAHPFGFFRNPRYLAGAVAARVKGLAGRSAPASAAEWLRAAYGEPLAEEVACPLVEAWSGVPAAELSPAVGAKLQGSGGPGRAIMLKLASRLTGRAVASGYSHEMPESPHVWHVYPEAGVSDLCRALATRLDGIIRLNARVEGITVEDGRAVAVKVDGKEHAAAAVVSTAPCHILPRLINGSKALAPLAGFRFRPMIFVNMRLEGRGLLPDTVLWTLARGLPFFRLTETTRSMPWLAPPGKTMITADIGCAVDDPIWSLPEEELGELCLAGLSEIVPDARRRYGGCRALRTPIAYPVLHKDYELERQRLERATGIAGLYSIGRNGEFAHILMEDVYWRTLRRMRELVAALRREPAPLAA